MKGIPEYPKDTAEGRQHRLLYDRFPAEAAAGIDEKALFVKKSS